MGRSLTPGHFAVLGQWSKVVIDQVQGALPIIVATAL